MNAIIPTGLKPTHPATPLSVAKLCTKCELWRAGKGGLSYAGIGSRSTPNHAAYHLRRLGSYIASLGGLLTSGGADGPDTWFEEGALSQANPDGYVTNHEGVLQPVMEIHLPWSGFNGHYWNNGVCYRVLGETERDLATEILHSSGVCTWLNRMGRGAYNLFCRNVYQILKEDWSKVDLVIYMAEENREKGTVSGGTRIAVYLARHFDIPCFNLSIKEDRDLLYDLLGYEDSSPCVNP